MEGYINENRWIDLSGLPKIPRGKWKGKVDWKNSIGCEIPFKYDNVESSVHVLGYERSNNTYIWMTIDNYVPEPRKFCVQYVVKCEFNHFLYNRIIDNAPEMVKYLENQSDAYKYACCSNKRIMMRCPVCGHERLSIIQEVFKEGFKCNVCGDGISYPNKLISNVLLQLHIPFIREVSKKYNGFEWCKQYRYDFAFTIGKQNIILEADGGYHRYPEQQLIDRQKDMLANENGYRVIRIDCDYTGDNKFEFIQKNIMSSELVSYLNFDNILWKECDRMSRNSILIDVCKMWEQDQLSSGEIKEKTGLSASAVHKYLKKGLLLKLCPSYSKKLAHKRKWIAPVACLQDGIIRAVFLNSRDIENTSLQILGVQCTENGVRGVCRGDHKTHKGFEFKDITKEEYERYKMIINNNEVVFNKEAIL